MAKINIHVPFAGKTITREINPLDRRPVAQYVQEIISEPPKNHAELEAMTALYDRLESPYPLPGCGFYSNTVDVSADRRCIGDISKLGKDIHVEATEYHASHILTGKKEDRKNKRGYMELRRFTHNEALRRYKTWQENRMQ